MRIRSWGIAVATLMLSLAFFPGGPALASENITAVSLSSNQVTPGFDMQFTLHTQPNVRQNVNRSEPTAIPDGWFIEISRNPNYPGGTWGVHRILLPENNVNNLGDNLYSFEAPQETGYYRFRMQTPEGEFYASEVFQVRSAPFVTVQPPRAFKQGETVKLGIYDENGNPWNIDNWGNQSGQHNIDVYYFGSGGPRGYAAPDGSASVRIERTAPGIYAFPASNVIAEYYVSFNRDSFLSVHSTSFDVVVNPNPVEDEAEEEPVEEEEELPPVLDPFQDDSETESNDVDGLPADDDDDSDENEVEEEVEEEVEIEIEDDRIKIEERRRIILRANELSESDRSFECPLEIGKAYRARNSSAVYVVVRPHRADGSINTEATMCARRAFTRERIFLTYFDSWSEVIVDDRINDIEDDTLRFMPYGPKYDPQYGALVKVVSDARVYLLLGGKRYWINSEQTFRRLGYSWNWIEDISEELLETYEEGSEITDTTRHPNYTLIKYEGDARVYRLEPDPNNPNRTVRRHIINEQAFNSLGYRWDRVVTVPDEEEYEEGETLRYEQRIRLRAR